jgi:hypothetical protein
MVSASPCRVAPRELSTKSDGTISGLAEAAGVPIVFMEDGAGAFWASDALAPPNVVPKASTARI